GGQGASVDGVCSRTAGFGGRCCVRQTLSCSEKTVHPAMTTSTLFGESERPHLRLPEIQETLYPLASAAHSCFGDCVLILQRRSTMRIILPAALSVPAILLLLACPLFAQEAVPAKDCTTIYDIELRNAQTVAPKFIEISPSDLVSLRKS